MPDITCADRFATVAHIGADAIALRHNNGVLTYRDLAGQAGAVAHLLRTNGVRPGDVVATVLDRSPMTVVAMLGIWAAGAAYAHVDAGEPDARIATMVSVTGARVVVTDRANDGRVPGSLVLEDIGTAPYEPVSGMSPNDLAFVVCVSGPAGVPVAIAVEHGSVRNDIIAVCQRIGPVPRTFATTTSFASDLGAASLFGALLTGGTLDIIDEQVARTPKTFAARLRKHPVGLLACTPTQLQVLLKTARPESVLPTDVLVVGGDVFGSELAETVLAARPELAVFSHYGHAGVGVLMHRVREADLDRDVVPLGRPLAGVEIAVLDDAGQPVADGEAGQLHVAGRAAEPYQASGDLVRRNEHGEVEFVGRADRQLTIDGHRVEPAEVEAVLLARRGIRQAVVTAEPAGRDQPLELVAYLVGLIEPTGLTRWLRQALPTTHVPARIHQVLRIPRSRNGDTNFTTLRKLAADAIRPAPVPVVRPRTPTERLIADIWCAVLKHVDVDVHTTFTDLGGDNFTSLAALGKLRRHFPSMTIEQFAAHPTIAALAAAIGPDQTASEVSIS